MELTSSPSVYRVIKYDGLFTQSVCYTFSIETAMSKIARKTNMGQIPAGCGVDDD